MPLKTVGASLLAKIVNDDAGSLAPSGALRFFASKLAPTDYSVFRTRPSTLFGLPDYQPRILPKQKLNFHINHVVILLFSVWHDSCSTLFNDCLRRLRSRHGQSLYKRAVQLAS
ncbi:hypothetical protein CER19_24825 [Pseudomonas sp. GL93]|nr:hypothetical protein CER19_24825 [Pseudomonas sp. GL93]